MGPDIVLALLAQPLHYALLKGVLLLTLAHLLNVLLGLSLVDKFLNKVCLPLTFSFLLGYYLLSEDLHFLLDGLPTFGLVGVALDLLICWGCLKFNCPLFIGNLKSLRLCLDHIVFSCLKVDASLHFAGVVLAMNLSFHIEHFGVLLVVLKELYLLLELSIFLKLFLCLAHFRVLQTPLLDLLEFAKFVLTTLTVDFILE